MDENEKFVWRIGFSGLVIISLTFALITGKLDLPTFVGWVGGFLIGVLFPTTSVTDMTTKKVK